MNHVRILDRLKAHLKVFLVEAFSASLIGELGFEFRSSIWWATSGRFVAKRLRRMQGVRLNVGCGENPTKGWINFDLQSGKNTHYWDCRRGLPFSDGAVVAIFSEHFLEHLDYKTDAERFLRECHRCIARNGIVRIVVPDAGRYIKLYADNDWSEIERRRPLIRDGDQYRDAWLGDRYSTKMEFINAVFRQGTEHKFAYDAETLIRLLRKAGFENVEQKPYGVSSDIAMAPDTPQRQLESLYVEGLKV